ncbi:RE1-silencing transcription factor [Megalops cyprinoides]|uniref:RE1-silencing transcription factor n=1 Tax=Megalops cyprinoides TaxID=118141 RepID=UPI001863D43B|nr:RE1-silencing transcription factor [Megalops cyprinoides]
MAAQTVYPMGVVMFTPLVGMPLGSEGHGVPELSRTDLAAPQLVMLANVALTSEGAGCDYMIEEKQMVELKTVGSSSYSDSEDEGPAPCDYDGHTDVPDDTYPETPQVTSFQGQEDREAEGEGEREESLPTSQEVQNAPAAVAKRKRNLRLAEAPRKKKPFHCKPCQYQAECEEEFVHHIRVHSAKKLIVVGRAEGEEQAKGAETEAAPESGEGVAYTKGVIRCERCGYNTNRYDHYMAHLKHHTKEGESQRVYKCTICTYTTVSQYHWKKHLRNHFPSKLYTCAQCCYFSDRKNNYVQHIRTHTGERPFRCPYCKYSSSQKTHLTRHMRTHSGERPFKCESCSYLAANQHEVTRHARQVHNGPKPLSCPHCQYKTADRSNYKKHVELHVNPRQFLCPVCSYAASKKCNLQYHIKSRHPDCSEITMDVSKVKLRVKKPESSATYYNMDRNSQYVLTGIKEGKEAQEKKTDRRENGEADKQTKSDPINLSTKKASKPVLSMAAKKEQRDKTPKRAEETSEKDNGKKTQKGSAEEKRAEKQSAQKAERSERTERSSSRVEKERVEQERLERERVEQERLERERVERERAEQEQLERERAEQERLERERVEQERLERERVEQERLERERVEQEKVEKERLEQEQLEWEKAERERAEQERIERERVEQEQLERERAEQEKLELEKKESERMAEEKETKIMEKSVKSGFKKPAKEENNLERMGRGRRHKPPEETQSKAAVTSCRKRKADILQPSSLEKEKPSSCNSQKAEDSDQQPQRANVLRGRRNALTRCQGPKGKVSKEIDQPTGVGMKKRTKKTESEPKLSLTGASKNQDRGSEGDSPCHPVAELQTAVGAASSCQGPPRVAGSTSAGEPETVEAPQKQDKPLAEAERTEVDQGKAPSEPKETAESGEAGSEGGVGGKHPPSLLELPAAPGKPADMEEDEGIHSHDGSDISDSVSEGSDDSGLSGGAAAKPAEPGTPSEEPPAPPKPQSHTCIFCDRTFSVEAEYRRHLNRHLVNVYYLESAAQGDQ